MSIDKQMGKDVVHIYKGMLLSHKKEQMMSFGDMDGDCHTE